MDTETRLSQSDGRHSEESGNQQTLMPPARRAALDALEREFHDLLNPAPQP
jgi:hypothetical protein